jgi:L-cysteine/cystine lyase
MNEFLLTSHRQLFWALPNKQYFNYGGQGVLAETTLAAINEAFKYVQRSGPFGLRVNAWTVQVAQQTRHNLAALLGVTADTITLTENVTVGCNIALWGLPWQAGDHIVLTDCEHPGVVGAIGELQRRYGIVTSTIPLLSAAQADLVSLVVAQLQPTTKLVLLSHVLWNTGQVLPLAEIIRAVKAYSPNIRLLVDAAQSVGMMPLNLMAMGVDFYAFTGHKWCCGPEGVGGLYVSAEARHVLQPTFIGWRSLDYEAAAGGGLLPDGRQYEIATAAYPLYAGLSEALATQNRAGTIVERYEHLVGLAVDLWQRLNDLPGVTCLLESPPASGLISFRLASGHHGQVVQQLEGQGIFLRTIAYPDCIRACVHYLTTTSEIDTLITALAQLP